jgi:hypothetical protein
MVSIRVPQSTLAALDARCAELGCSRSEYVANMIEIALLRAKDASRETSRQTLSAPQREHLGALLQERGVLPVAVGTGCAPDTLRRVLRGRACNGPAYTKIVAYLAAHRS